MNAACSILFCKRNREVEVVVLNIFMSVMWL